MTSHRPSRRELLGGLTAADELRGVERENALRFLPKAE